MPNVTTHRVLTRDRSFVDELNYKGWSIKLADWVHLSNPDDPSRPIIGQVFRCWVSEELYVLYLAFDCLSDAHVQRVTEKERVKKVLRYHGIIDLNRYAVSLQCAHVLD